MTVEPGQPMGGRAGATAVLERHAHGEVVIRVTGALDIRTTADLDIELAIATAAGSFRKLVLDLSGVWALDSTGLRALWTIRHALREVGAQLVLQQPSPIVVHVLETSGLTAMFDVV